MELFRVQDEFISAQVSSIQAKSLGKAWMGWQVPRWTILYKEQCDMHFLTWMQQYIQQKSSFLYIFSKSARWVYPSTSVYHYNVIADCKKNYFWFSTLLIFINFQ